MTTALFIGGPLDGQRKEWDDIEWEDKAIGALKGQPEREYFPRSLTIGGPDILAHYSLSPLHPEAIQMLIDGYRKPLSDDEVTAALDAAFPDVPVRNQMFYWDNYVIEGVYNEPAGSDDAETSPALLEATQKAFEAQERIDEERERRQEEVLRVMDQWTKRIEAVNELRDKANSILMDNQSEEEVCRLYQSKADQVAKSMQKRLDELEFTDGIESISGDEPGSWRDKPPLL